MRPHVRFLVIGALLAAACSDPPAPAFRVDGFVDVPTGPGGSMLALWHTGAAVYKFGDGVRLGSAFAIAFDDAPPDAALDDGVGIALLALVPELTTVPDGPTDPARIQIDGITARYAVTYRREGATGPAWVAALPLGFGCARCVDGADLDGWEPAPCEEVLVQPAPTPRCQWISAALGR